MKRGTKIICKVDKWSLYTRNGVRIEIKKGQVLTKTRDLLSDKIALRNMFFVDDLGTEVDVPNSLLEKYFEILE